MRKSLVAMIGVTALAITTFPIASFAASTSSEELKIVNHTNNGLSFMGICKDGGTIVGNKDLEPHSEVIYKISGKDAMGEIGYFDLKNKDVINFKYDYTQPGGKVNVDGGNNYRFQGKCTLDGNEIDIFNK